MIFSPGHQGGHFVTLNGSWRASERQISLGTQTRVARMMKDYETIYLSQSTALV